MTSTATVIHLTSKNNVAPSPADYSVPSTIGHDTPRYTIQHRPTNKEPKNTAGYTYNPNTIGTGLKKSLSSRPKDPKVEPTPGPSYVPPPFGQNTPRVAFHGKPVDKKTYGVDSPGPGKYDTYVSSSSPRWTVGHRKFNEEKPSGPGPGKYNPNYDTVLSNAPQTHIRSKVGGSKPQVTPGPYDVPHQLDTKSSVFHRRAKELTHDNFPGPGKYTINSQFGQESPRFTVRPRCEVKENVTGAPYQKLPDITGNESPKYSFSNRSKATATYVTPGPDYMPPPFAQGSIKHSFQSKHKLKEEISPGPGPGKYNTQNEASKGPRFTIKARNFGKDIGEVDGPGPGKYCPDYEKVLPSAPKTNIRTRTDSHTVNESPGYFDAHPVESGPKFTIGRKENHSVAPGIPS